MNKTVAKQIRNKVLDIMTDTEKKGGFITKFNRVAKKAFNREKVGLDSIPGAIENLRFRLTPKQVPKARKAGKRRAK